MFHKKISSLLQHSNSKAVYSIFLFLLFALTCYPFTPALAAACSSPHHNQQSPGDVDGDGLVTSFDTLILIDIMQSGSTSGVPFYDVNCDGVFTPEDVAEQEQRYLPDSEHFQLPIPFLNGAVTLISPLAAGTQYRLYFVEPVNSATNVFTITQATGLLDTSFLEIGKRYIWYVIELDSLNNETDIVISGDFWCQALIDADGVHYNEAVTSANPDLLNVSFSNDLFTIKLNDNKSAAYFAQYFHFDGQGESDQIGLSDMIEVATNGNGDWVSIRQDRIIIGSSSLHSPIFHKNVEDISAVGHGSSDVAYLYDSPGDDLFTGNPNTCVLTDNLSYRFQAANYRYVHGYAFDGYDRAELEGSNMPDIIYSYMESITKLYDYNRSQYFIRPKYFESVVIDTGEGDDYAYLYDSGGDDYFLATAGSSKFCRYKSSVQPDFNDLCGNLDNQLTTIEVQDCRYVYAYSEYGGNDSAEFYDSSAQDYFKSFYPYTALIFDTQNKYYARTYNFKSNTAHSVNGGDDVAMLFDTPGDDFFTADPTQAVMEYDNGNIVNTANLFRWVHAYGTTVTSYPQNDIATVYGAGPADEFYCGGSPYWYCRIYDHWALGSWHIRVKKGFHVTYPTQGNYQVQLTR